MTDRFLTCSCRPCGCICTTHSPTGERLTCATHTVEAVSQAIGHEIVRLVVMGLFVAVVCSWAAILGS